MQNNFNYNNLYKLITKEDSSYLHKILGSIVLLNYGYRYIYYIVTGSMNFKTNFDLYLLFLHGLLSTSSLIFHIPNIRNPRQPMIYPEYRMHSIIFALRSVICCFIYFYNYNYKYIMITCGLTFILSDIITLYYNQFGKNGKTMRNMPFDKSIILEDQNTIISIHSIHQIGATLFMFGNIETAFSPMFAIQVAALLMTLVRKSIITSSMWHLLYSMCLGINYLLFISMTPALFILLQILVNIHYFIIFKYKINKYIAWLSYFLFIIYYKECGHEKNINEFIFYKYNIEWYYFIHFFIISLYIIFFYRYKVLFNIILQK